MVNHLTRIQQGYICGAGIDTQVGGHVRPGLVGRLYTKLLARNGGPFDIAYIVGLGPTKSVGSPPEVEDYRFSSGKVTQVGVASPDEFWSLLKRSARRRLSVIFGPDLISLGPDSGGVLVRKGMASLRCLVPAGRPVLYLRPRPGKSDQIRMGVSDGMYHLDLSVGLTRPFASSADLPAVHWLQVNNTHFENNPRWQLG